MKSDFLLAITQLSAEKNLPKEVVLAAVESALVSAYRKEDFAPNQNITVRINRETGRVEVWAEKTVVERVADSRAEISQAEARKINKDSKVGDTLMVESTPSNAGRIAAQTARQVILQRLHEAEHSAIIEEYADKEGDVITGVVQRMEPTQITVDLGRTEAVLPAAEQVRTERYRPGQRLKIYILQVAKTPKGPRVIVSRSHPNLLRRLFELEVPEVYSSAVEIKAIAREAGFRSKVAVSARQEGIDPVGCCVGLRGIRIQNIVNELGGEKIDVIPWSSDIAVFVASALSPAQISSVSLNHDDKIATVVVPDRQLSLAIGKEGQNARLAAKLTGWRIDIKSSSSVEAEKVTEARQAAKAQIKEKEEAAEKEAAPAEAQAEVPAAPEVTEAPAEKAPEPVVVAQKAVTPPIPIPFPAPKGAAAKTQLRFADEHPEIKARAEAKAASVKKKKGKAKTGAEDGIRLKKRRRETEVVDTEVADIEEEL